MVSFLALFFLHGERERERERERDVSLSDLSLFLLRPDQHLKTFNDKVTASQFILKLIEGHVLSSHITTMTEKMSNELNTVYI